MTSKRRNRRFDGCKRALKVFLFNALIRKYEATVPLLTSLVWPLLAGFSLILFRPQIVLLASELTKSISNSSKIVVAGVELEVFDKRIKKEDSRAYAMISVLTREELKMILDLSSNQFYYDSNTKEFNDMKPILTSLQESGLLSLEYGVVPPPGVKGNTKFGLTPLGIRIYDELQKLLINIIDELPKESP